MRHAISNRVGYLAVAGVLVAVLSVGLGDRLLTRWAYAFEQGRIQANSDELAGVQFDAEGLVPFAAITPNPTKPMSGCRSATGFTRSFRSANVLISSPEK